MNRAAQALHMLGVHPVVAVGMAAVDFMLFAGEGASLAVSWPVSISVAIALTILCALVQRYGYKEHWGLAIGKAMLVGLLTAIPTAIPSLGTVAGGMLGTTSLVLGSGGAADK